MTRRQGCLRYAAGRKTGHSTSNKRGCRWGRSACFQRAGDLGIPAQVCGPKRGAGMLPEPAGRNACATGGLAVALGIDLQSGCRFGRENGLMQQDTVSSFRFQVSGRVVAAMLAAALFAGCSPERDAQPKKTEAIASTGTNDSDLLMRVRFAGTTALMADTNAAYLTNIAALPETAALGKRIVERFASLPERLVQRGAGSAERGTADASLSSTINDQPSTNALESLFADLVRVGFELELRGDSNGVISMLLGGKADRETTAKWNQALAAAAKDWFGEGILAKSGNWSAGQARMQVKAEQDSVVFRLSSQKNLQPSTFNIQPGNLTNVLEVEMGFSLLPNMIQRSIFGGFTSFRFAVFPAEQSLKVRGMATYSNHLPLIEEPAKVPIRLISERLTSFSYVRNPRGWLQASSALRRFLPQTDEGLFFWGTDDAPFAFHAASRAKDAINPGEFVDAIAREIQSVANAIQVGNVIADPALPGHRLVGIPFLAPSITYAQSEGENFWTASLGPPISSTNHIAPTLVSKVEATTNLVLYDWEFTAPRITGWLYVSQLALMLSEHQQLREGSAASRWVLSVGQALPNGGNTVTEITQTGPRELSLARRAPIAFTSLELLWLANWLESDNFPRANFLVPAPQPDVVPGGP
jgi:hypothetical protein